MDDALIDRVAVFFKALADPARLRILGTLADRPHAGHELAAELGLTPPTISHHMRKLTDAGLVDITPDAQSRIYSLRVSALRELSSMTASERSPEPARHEDDRIIRAFFDGPRLRQIPAARKKRVVILRRLLESFAPEKSYSEREVNDILRVAHDDVATLRRELIDYGFMVRDHGVYRVASTLPPRGPTVSQEVGDESAWLRDLVAAATARAVTREEPPPGTPLSRRR
jgi:biotin operon repressor